MSIKFYCGCGKRLKAKSAMAARRTVCPACGNPVGIPSLQPTQRGTDAAPMTYQQRRARENQTAVTHGRLTAEPVVASQPAAPIRREPALPLHPEFDPGKIKSPLQETPIDFRAKPRKRKRKWQAWPLETRWYQSLFYPLLAFPLVLGLALVFTLMSGLAVFFWRDIVEFPEQQPYVWWIPCLVFPVLVAGYGCAFFRCVLASALAGEAGEIRWPGADVPLILKGTVALVVCAALGPAPLLAIAYLFWLEGGDPALADWLILSELLVVAVAHLLLSLVATSLRDRLRDANPARVVELVHELGWRGHVLLLTSASLVVAIVLVTLDTLAALCASSAWLPLFGCWVALFYALTFFFRCLGLYSFRRLKLSGRGETTST